MLYVAHRLFAAHDRILGARIARELGRGVGHDNVFLPYCDTDEERLVATVKGRRLFELDRERLRRIKGMLAVLHGPSFDDGVCLEVGFASAIGVPVVVLATDFQTYTLGANSSAQLTCPDPLIDAIAARVVNLRGTTADGPAGADRFDAFAQRTGRALADAVVTAVDSLIALIGQPALSRARSADRPLPRGELFLEPSPIEAEQAAQWTAQLAASGHRATSARRLTAPLDSSVEHLLALALADWDAATVCDTLIVNVEGPETPPGAAALIGACLAHGSRIFAQYRPRLRTHAPGREPNYRNLMVQYAVTRRFDSLDEIVPEL